MGGLFLALVLLHFFLHVGLGLRGEAPDLALVALLLAAREVGPGWGGGVGLALGLLEDSLSVLAFGANALALTLAGILGGRTRDLFVGDSLRFLFGYVALGKLLRDFVHWLAVGEDLREPFLVAVLIRGSAGALYAALVGVVVAYPFLRRKRLL